MFPDYLAELPAGRPATRSTTLAPREVAAGRTASPSPLAVKYPVQTPAAITDKAWTFNGEELSSGTRR